MALGNFIKETRGELKHVSWPTRRQALAYTVIVVAISIALAVVLGFFDYLFSSGLRHIIGIF